MTEDENWRNGGRLYYFAIKKNTILPNAMRKIIYSRFTPCPLIQTIRNGSHRNEINRNYAFKSNGDYRNITSQIQDLISKVPWVFYWQPPVKCHILKISSGNLEVKYQRRLEIVRHRHYADIS